MKRKILSVFLALSMLLTLVPTMAIADTYGDLSYGVNGDKTGITVSGCNKNATEIVIPETINAIVGYDDESEPIYKDLPVTMINMDAFQDYSNLTDVYYSGSEEQFLSILGWDNENLTDANVRYNSIIPTPVPTPAPTPLPIAAAEITRTDDGAADAYTFEVNAADKYENCFVYAAVYDENGALLAVSRVPLETEGNTSVSVEKPADGMIAKVFVWADTLQSVIEKAKEFPLV